MSKLVKTLYRSKNHFAIGKVLETKKTYRKDDYPIKKVFESHKIDFKNCYNIIITMRNNYCTFSHDKKWFYSFMLQFCPPCTFLAPTIRYGRSILEIYLLDFMP